MDGCGLWSLVCLQPVRQFTCKDVIGEDQLAKLTVLRPRHDEVFMRPTIVAGGGGPRPVPDSAVTLIAHTAGDMSSAGTIGTFFALYMPSTSSIVCAPSVRCDRPDVMCRTLLQHLHVGREAAMS